MYYRVSKFFALIIGVEACLVMAGWIFSVESLTRILPSGINMKFPTALVFFLAGIGLYYITRSIQDNYEVSQVILPGIALLIFLIMSALLASGLSGGRTGIESLFVINNQNPINALGSGVPSLPTTINFVLFGLASILTLFPSLPRHKFLKFFGYSILIIGLMATIGYILQIPVLYYQYSVATIPMALNTALTFVLLGLGLVIISSAKTIHET